MGNAVTKIIPAGFLPKKYHFLIGRFLDMTKIMYLFKQKKMNYSNYFPFSPTNEQQTTFALLQDFIERKDTPVFILKGYAGTGKTSLVAAFVKYLSEKDIPFFLMSSTGRAAKILSDKLSEELNCGVSTIHSKIYCFNEINQDLEKLEKLTKDYEVDDTGQIKLVFELKNEEKSEKNPIYIVDEASMVADAKQQSLSFATFGSGKLLSDLFEFNPSGKFIFVGDPCQLPPINQKISPALSSSYIQNTFSKKALERELIEMKRQTQNNQLIDVSMQLRALYQKPGKTTYPKLQLKGNKNVCKHSSTISFINSYIASIRAHGYEYSTLLCHTNNQCSEINELIRTALYKNSTKLEKNELLLVTQNNHLNGLANGDLIRIMEIGDYEYRAGFTFRNIKLEVLGSKRQIDSLIMENLLSQRNNGLTDKQHKDLLIDYYRRMAKENIRQKDKEFSARMLKDPYLNAIRSVYGYALTCHKSQGGEWNEVYLHLDNSHWGMPVPSIYQWWYTAITRAKEMLHTFEHPILKEYKPSQEYTSLFKGMEVR